MLSWHSKMFLVSGFVLDYVQQFHLRLLLTCRISTHPPIRISQGTQHDVTLGLNFLEFTSFIGKIHNPCLQNIQNRNLEEVAGGVLSTLYFFLVLSSLSLHFCIFLANRFEKHKDICSLDWLSDTVTPQSCQQERRPMIKFCPISTQFAVRHNRRLFFTCTLHCRNRWCLTQRCKTYVRNLI